MSETIVGTKPSKKTLAGTIYPRGRDGGYYSIQASQDSTDTLRLAFIASDKSLETIPDQVIRLPKPVKGVDYWTEDDKREIEGDSEAALDEIIEMQKKIINGLPFEVVTVDSSHISDTSNPHKVTPEQIGAASVEYVDAKCKAKAGFIYPLATEVVPEGFLLCDGAEYGREEYPELFAAIGTMYGEGDGETTFNVPNLQTRVPVGADGGEYCLGDTGGEAEHTLTIEEMPSHDHYDGTNPDVIVGTVDGTVTTIVFSDPDQEGSRPTTATGGNQPHNNMQPYTVVNYIIATGKDTAVSVSDIILGAQAIPLEVKYGGTGATNGQDACKNILALHAIEDPDHPGCYYRMVDGEKEWLNHPLVNGVEYRTTERIDGDPLYVKEIYCGILSDQMTVTLPAATIYRWNGWTSIGTTLCGDYQPADAWRISVQFMGNEKKVRFRLGTEVAAAKPVGYLQVWFKKS